MNQTPTNFTGAPDYASRHPTATPASGAGYEGVAITAPAPSTTQLLTVRPDRKRADRAAQEVVTPSKELLRAIPGLKGGSPIDLVPPMRRGGTWHLDTRATAVRRLPAAPGAVARFAIPGLSREHYLTPAVAAIPGQKGGAQGAQGVRPFLVFVLGPEVVGHPGYYELHPLR